MADDQPMTHFPSCKPVLASPGLTSSPDHPQVYCFPLSFFHSSSSLSTFMSLEIKLLYILLVNVLFIIYFMYILQDIYESVYFMGNLRGSQE